MRRCILRMRSFQIHGLGRYSNEVLRRSQRVPSCSTTTLFMKVFERGGLGANISQLCDVPVPISHEPNSERVGLRHALNTENDGNRWMPTASVCQQNAKSASERPSAPYASAGPG